MTTLYNVIFTINGETNEEQFTDKRQALIEAQGIFKNLSAHARRRLEDLYIMEYDFANKQMDVIKDYLTA